MAQMDNLMQQTIAQATQGQKIPPKVQKDIDQRRGEIIAMMKELLDWTKLEPLYVRVYQKTFSQQEVDGMIAFYKTPAGQAVIAKMPTVMQNTIEEMQQMMGPVMQKMQKMQQDVVAPQFLEQATWTLESSEIVPWYCSVMQPHHLECRCHMRMP